MVDMCLRDGIFCSPGQVAEAGVLSVPAKSECSLKYLPKAANNISQWSMTLGTLERIVLSFWFRRKLYELIILMLRNILGP